MKVTLVVAHPLLPLDREYSREFDNVKDARLLLEKMLLAVLQLGWYPISVKVDGVEKLIKTDRDIYEVTIDD